MPDKITAIRLSDDHTASNVNQGVAVDMAAMIDAASQARDKLLFLYNSTSDRNDCIGADEVRGLNAIFGSIIRDLDRVIPRD